MCSINNNFWADPPWGDGNRKYRLGLSPIENERWLNRKPDKELINYKKKSFRSFGILLYIYVHF